MTATWDSVASNPAYQALSPDQQESARQQYFSTVVAPKVPKENLDMARQQFDTYSVAKTLQEPQSESQYWHDVGQSPNANFPNVKEEGGILPIETTYNPDMTVDSSRVDLAAPFRHLATGVGDLYQQAENKSTNTTPAAVNAMVAMSALPSVARGVASAGESLIPKSFQDLMSQETSAAGPISNIVKSIRGTSAPVYDPVTTHTAISDAYGAAKEAAKPYYNLMRDIGSGETADASELKPALDSMITDIQNTPFHEATSELSYLKQQVAKIGDDGRIPLNDMVQLKQNLNSNFNPKRFAQGSDTPYAAVGGLVDDSLKDAAERIPEFGEAKTLADKNWLNTVKSPFEDNTVLKKIWKPEDFYAKKSVDNGMLEDLPDPTKARATAMLKNIKTPVQLDAIRRVLPQDLSDVLSQAKINDVIQKEGAGRLASAGKAVMGIPKIAISPLKGTGEVLTNAGRTFIPDLTPEGKALIDAATAPAPTLSTKYQKPFSTLKANVQQQSDLADEMQPFSYSKPVPKPKQLTYQPSNMSVPSQGPSGTIPMNPAIRESLGQSPSTVAEQLPGRTVEENAAWEQNKATKAQEIAIAKRKALEDAAVQKEAETKAIQDAEVARRIKEAGWKKGGSVRKNLTAEFLAARKRA